MPHLATVGMSNRLTFHYRTHGAPDGLPLLLLHGSYASSRWWEPLFEVLPEEIYAIAPDLRGCGASDKPNEGYRIEEMAGDLAAFIDAFQPNLLENDLHLAAHSSSGAIAMEYVLEHPEAASTLILIDSVPVEGVFSPIDTLMLLEQIKQEAAQGDATLLQQALATLMPTIQPDTPFFRQLLDDAMQMAPAAFTAIAESLGRWNRFADAKRINLPTLLLWGEQDSIVSRDATTRTLLAIPGAANLEVLRGCGHSPMIETPLVLAERIVEFMTQDFAGFGEIRQSAH